MPVSALAAGSGGWIQNVSFMVLGVLLIAHAVGLHLGVRTSRWGVLGPVILAVSGLCIVGAGVFPATDGAGEFSPDRRIHSGVSVLAFLTAGFGVITLSRRLTRDPGWSGYPRVLWIGIGVLVLLFSFGGLARSPGTPLHRRMGIVQRGLIGIWLAGILILGLRLLRIARNRHRRPPARPS